MGVLHRWIGMVERLLPAEDPVLENVLKWTVERDAKDVRRLLKSTRLKSTFIFFLWNPGSNKSIFAA